MLLFIAVVLSSIPDIFLRMPLMSSRIPPISPR